MKTNIENGFKVRDLGLMAYRQAYEMQQQCVHAVLAGEPQSLLLCEHPTVLTCGRLAKAENMLMTESEIARRGVAIHHTDRGGDITLHAPGQLVLYPILNLANFGKDLRFYLNSLEQVAIDLLSEFDIVASRFPGQTGVWVGDRKVASIGIGVRRWVSYHGLAINVNTDLNLFSMIKPCGLDVRMTSISQIKGKSVSMDKVKRYIIDRFKKTFSLNSISISRRK